MGNFREIKDKYEPRPATILEGSNGDERRGNAGIVGEIMKIGEVKED